MSIFIIGIIISLFYVAMQALLMGGQRQFLCLSDARSSGIRFGGIIVSVKLIGCHPRGYRIVARLRMTGDLSEAYPRRDP